MTLTSSLLERLASLARRAVAQGHRYARGRAAGALLGLVAACTGGAAAAHPHSFIEVQSKLIFASNGLVTAIEEQWTFDELYTSYVVEEMAKGKRPTPAVVARFASQVIANLEPYGYFLEVLADHRKVKLGKITQYASELRGERLWLKFVAPLATPIDPRRQATVLSVFDPTYYIDMQHETPQAVTFDQAPASCRATLQRPKPGADLMARAFGMDKNAAVDDTLGRQFAQKVVLACH